MRRAEVVRTLTTLYGLQNFLEQNDAWKSEKKREWEDNINDLQKRWKEDVETNLFPKFHSESKQRQLSLKAQEQKKQYGEWLKSKECCEDWINSEWREWQFTTISFLFNLHSRCNRTIKQDAETSFVLKRHGVQSFQKVERVNMPDLDKDCNEIKNLITKGNSCDDIVTQLQFFSVPVPNISCRGFIAAIILMAAKRYKDITNTESFKKILLAELEYCQFQIHNLAPGRDGSFSSGTIFDKAIQGGGTGLTGMIADRVAAQDVRLKQVELSEKLIQELQQETLSQDYIDALEDLKMSLSLFLNAYHRKDDMTAGIFADILPDKQQVLIFCDKFGKASDIKDNFINHRNQFERNNAIFSTDCNIINSILKEDIHIDDVASINIFNKTLKDISEKILEQFVIQSQKRFLENLSGVVKTPSAATPLSEDAPTQSLP